MKKILRPACLALGLLAASSLAAADQPAWAGVTPGGAPVRVAVGPTSDPGLVHLAWPKAIRAQDGTIILGYQIGTHHGDGSSPAVSLSTDNGKTFSAPHVLRKFGPDQEYSNSGNMALGLAHDGSVILISHGHRRNEANNIFGWRSTDNGRTWQAVDTSRLGPDKTGSATGTVVQLPGKRLMIVGHYRINSKPQGTGIWQSISEDDGLTWGEPTLVTNVNGGEPVLVRHQDRLLVFIRGRGPASTRQYIAVSDDLGRTWRTELSNLTAQKPDATVLTHPFAMVNPHHPDLLVAATFERPLPGVATLWRANPQTLEFSREKTLVTLPKIEGDTHIDFGYPWLLPFEGNRWLMFYYHGQRDNSAIWVTEFEY
jgi:hypothetical protein